MKKVTVAASIAILSALVALGGGYHWWSTRVWLVTHLDIGDGVVDEADVTDIYQRGADLVVRDGRAVALKLKSPSGIGKSEAIVKLNKGFQRVARIMGSEIAEPFNEASPVESIYIETYALHEGAVLSTYAVERRLKDGRVLTLYPAIFEKDGTFGEKAGDLGAMSSCDESSQPCPFHGKDLNLNFLSDPDKY